MFPVLLFALEHRAARSASRYHGCRASAHRVRRPPSQSPAHWSAAHPGASTMSRSAPWSSPCIERTGFPADHLAHGARGTARRLKDKQPNAWGAAFEVAVGVYFILWWCGLVPFPSLLRQREGADPLARSDLGRVWWPVLALMVARLVYNLVQWLRPRWKVVRACCRSAPRRAGSRPGYLYQAGHWLTASGTLPADQLADIDHGVNIGIHWAIVAAARSRCCSAARNCGGSTRRA